MSFAPFDTGHLLTVVAVLVNYQRMLLQIIYFLYPRPSPSKTPYTALY